MKNTIISLSLLLSLCLFGVIGLLAANVPKIKNIRIREGGDTSAPNYRIVIIAKEDDKNEIASIRIEITPVDNAPAPIDGKLNLTFSKENSEKNKTVFINKDLAFKTSAVDYTYEVRATMYNAKNEVIGETEIQKVTVVKKCKDKYKLRKVDVTETSAGGVSAIAFQFAFDKNSDLPENVIMVIQLKDCGQNTQNIKINLKYDAKTDTYVGSSTFKENTKCPWELAVAEIGAYNECNELTAWSLELGKTKSNGKGTRQVATTNNGSPGLL